MPTKTIGAVILINTVSVSAFSPNFWVAQGVVKHPVGVTFTTTFSAGPVWKKIKTWVDIYLISRYPTHLNHTIDSYSDHRRGDAS